MKKLKEVLSNNRSTLVGRTILAEEILTLKSSFSSRSLLVKLIPILEEFRLIGQEIQLDEHEDLSHFGVQMKWMAPADQAEEALNFFPGAVVTADDFVPIGMCLEGSGDPYFLKLVGDELELYRVSHEAEQVHDKNESEFFDFVGPIDLVFEKSLEP